MALKEDIVAKISELSVLVAQIPDASADPLQAQLDAAVAALQAETAQDAVDAAKVVSLQGKISAALAALQG